MTGIFHRLAVCFIGCVVAVGAGAAQPDEQLETYLAGLKTWSADFRQTESDSGGQVVRRAEGHFDLQRPGKFRWSYRAPTAQQLISDGRQLWFYDEDLQQVTVRALDGGLAATPALLLSGGGSVREVFEVSSLPRGADGSERYRLKPKQGSGDFRELQLAFLRGQPSSMQLQDKLGSMTRLEFSAAKRNPTLAAELFKFVPPAGVDVIGRAATGP